MKKVLRGNGRVEQEEFTKFHAYDNFTPRFCNPAAAIQAAVDLALEHRISSSAGVKHILLQAQGALTPAPLSHWPATVLPDISLHGQIEVVP